MNILILSPFLPYPLDQGGKIRIFNIIKNLSRSHAVTLAAIVDDRDATELGPLREICEEIVLVERPARLWPDRLTFFTSFAPYNVIRYHSATMRRALQQLQQKRRFDLIQVEFSMMWKYAGLFAGTPVILDAHNIEHKNVRQIGSSARNPLWRMMYQIEEKRLRTVEERAWRECALCFAVSEMERDEIAARVGDQSKVVTAANGVDPHRFAYRTKEKPAKKILFLGGMDYAPNLDAARYFLDEIFPMVRSKESEARLLLVGRELGKLGEVLQLPGVETHESVPEVLPFFYEADVLVVPLRQGAGTRIKLLEAMAAGLPVVTTSKGCEGIEVENGRELLIADSADGFAAALLEIMEKPERGRAMAENARRLVMERYTWESAAKVMSKQYLKNLLRKGRQVPRI
jgi:polysaccharide biosynthesis protein PslH